MRDARDLLVLLGDAALGVDQEQADLGSLHRHVGTENAEMLNAVVDLGLAADACRVDKGKGADLVFHLCIHRVTRGACDVGNDQTVFADELVDDGGFSRIGLSDDGDVNAVVLLLLRVPLTECVDAGIQQISRSASVDGGNADGIHIKAQLVELIEFHGRPSYAVTLVDAGDDGLSALFEHNGDVAVAGGQSRSDVAHKDDDVCRVNGKLSLHAHLREDDVVGLGLNASRVDHGQLFAAPLGLAVDAVTRNTGGVLHNGATLADQFIKQGTFANVGASHDGDNRICHSILSNSFFIPFPAEPEGAPRRRSCRDGRECCRARAKARPASYRPKRCPRLP